MTVQVRAADPDGVQACRLFWAVNEGVWQSDVMVVSNAAYRGVISGQPAGAIVQFYVRGIDALNSTSYFPAAGAASRALYAVRDGQASLKPVHHLRLIMLTGYTVKFHADDLFRGAHDSIGIDRSGRLQGRLYGATNAQEEILVKQVLNRAGGIPCQYDDIIRCIAPRADYSSSALLMAGRYQGPYFDSLWPDGGDGSLHKFELIYYSTTTVDGNPESLKVAPNKNLQNTLSIDVQDMGDDPEYYRWHHLSSNRQQYDDYRGLVRLCKLFSMSGAALDAAAPQVMDEDQWMRLFAAHGLQCIFDTYNYGGHHNMLFYQRPSDGRMLALPTDMDWAYEPSIWSRGTNAPLYGNNGAMPSISARSSSSRAICGACTRTCSI